MTDLQYSRRNWIAQVLCSAAAAPLLADESLSRPLFFTTQQNETLIVLGEAIIPGSAAAGCNRVIDLILSLESQTAKRQMAESLAAFDNNSKKRYGQVFSKLQPEQQIAILTYAAAPDSALHPAFKVVKEWMADTYWTSQQGLRELGWKGRMAWTAFDGCPHESSNNNKH